MTLAFTDCSLRIELPSTSVRFMLIEGKRGTMLVCEPLTKNANKAAWMSNTKQIAVGIDLGTTFQPWRILMRRAAPA